MDINTYIKMMKTPVYIPFEKDKEEILKLLDFIKEDYKKDFNIDVIIKPVSSTDLFPEHICLDNQDYILWDFNYWPFYANFLEDYANFLHMRDEAQKISNNRFKQNFIFFLSFVFEEVPSLSYICGLESYRLSLLSHFSEEDLDSVSSIKEFLGFKNRKNMLFSIIFIFHHEIFHIMYRKNSKLIDKSLKRMDIYIFYFRELFFENLELNENRRKEYEIILDLLKNNKNKKIVEEFLCDVRAIRDSIELIRQIFYIEEYGEEKLIKDTLEAAHLSLIFQCYISTLKFNWKNTYNIISNMDEIRQSIGATWRNFDLAGAQVASIMDEAKKMSLSQNYMATSRHTVAIHFAITDILLDFGTLIMPETLFNATMPYERLVSSIDEMNDFNYITENIISAKELEEFFSLEDIKKGKLLFDVALNPSFKLKEMDKIDIAMMNQK